MLKKILIVLGLVSLIWIVISVVRVRIFSQRAGQFIRSTVKFERQGDADQHVLVVGDSLAYGTGTSSPEKSVAGLVAARYPGAKVTNLGFNGKRTKELAVEMNQLEGHYDLILIIVGGNDILRPWVNLKQSGENLKSIYKEASTKSSQVVALTTGDFRYTTFFLWPLNLYYSDRSVELRNHAQAAASQYKNVMYIDMVEHNKTAKFDQVKEASDHLHLSDDGAQYWLDAIVITGALPGETPVSHD